MAVNDLLLYTKLLQYLWKGWLFMAFYTFYNFTFL